VGLVCGDTRRLMVTTDVLPQQRSIKPPHPHGQIALWMRLVPKCVPDAGASSGERNTARQAPEKGHYSGRTR